MSLWSSLLKPTLATLRLPFLLWGSVMDAPVFGAISDAHIQKRRRTGDEQKKKVTINGHRQLVTSVHLELCMVRYLPIRGQLHF